MEAALSEAERLCAVQDPETEPYKSQYEARDVLEAAQKQLLSAMLEGGATHDPEVMTQVAVMDHRLGVIGMNTEESHYAEPKLGTCVAHFAGDFQQAMDAVPVARGADEDGAALAALPAIAVTDRIRQHAVPVVDALNHLGVLWTGREAPHRSRAYLAAAAGLFEALEAEGAPVSDELAALHTHTNFFLAQVYGLLGDAEQSAAYCCATLQRQLAEPGLNALDWCQNCMRLSDVFVGGADFVRGAHCLQACDAVLLRAPDAEPGSEEADGEGSKRQLTADVQRSWAHLWVSVLTVAREAHMGGLEDLPPPPAPADLPFRDLVPEDPPATAGIASFDAARDVFKRANALLSRAAEYYVMDGFVTTHVSIQRDVSTLYKCLSAFEPDPKRQLTMHARRVAALQPLLDGLNKEAFDDLHKHISFEVGEAFTEMVDLKIGRIEAKVESTPGYAPKASELAKAAEYCRGAIAAFRHFTGMYSAAEGASASADDDGQNPRDLEDYEAGPFLRAHFYVARMLDKLHVVSPPAARVELLAQSLRKYEWLCQFAPRYEQEFQVELSMCREMVQLLPPKLARLNAAR